MKRTEPKRETDEIEQFPKSIKYARNERPIQAKIHYDKMSINISPIINSHVNWFVLENHP